MVDYVKMGKEDFRINDWVCVKEANNDFTLKFNVKGNVTAARNMVNAKLKGIIGSYCAADSVDCEPSEELNTHTVTHKTSDMEERTKVKPSAQMPGSTRGL
jgi:hypothetical protein